MKKFSLMLDGTRFAFCKLDDDGERVGAIHEWRIHACSTSMLPCDIFHHVRRKVLSATAHAPGSYQAIANALCEAARDCDCEWQVLSSPACVLWLKNRRRFVSFGISDNWGTKQTRALLNFRVDTQGFIHPEANGLE